MEVIDITPVDHQYSPRKMRRACTGFLINAIRGDNNVIRLDTATLISRKFMVKQSNGKKGAVSGLSAEEVENFDRSHASV